MELIPIELKLKGWVKILFFINIKRNIWHYTAPALRGTIWEKVYRKDDQGPPRFPYCDRAWWVWCTKAATIITFTATGHGGYGVPKLPQSSHLLRQGMVGMVYQSCHNHHIYCDRAWWVWCTKAATIITFTATGHGGYGVPKLPQSSHLLRQGMVGMVYQSCHNHHIYCDRA